MSIAPPSGSSKPLTADGSDRANTSAGASNEVPPQTDPSAGTLDQERLLAAVMQSSNDAIIAKSLDAIITAWNQGAERMFGYTAEEAIGRPIDLIVPEERREDVRSIIARIGRGEHVANFETLRRRKDGKLIEVSISVSPVRAADGRIIGAAKVARDIRTLVAAERKFRLAVEASPSGMVMVDGGGEDRSRECGARTPIQICAR